MSLLAPSVHEAASAGGPAGITVGMVRVSLLARQFALAAAVAAALVVETSLLTLALVTALALTSQLGLHSTRVLQLVERHPSIALVDVLMVAMASAVTGPRHPVALAALTSALIIGVLFKIAVSPLLVILLLSGHAVSLTRVDELALDDVVGVPIVVLSLAAVGVGFRRLSEVARSTDLAASQARQAAATAEERLRLARDVHDTVAKSVQGVALLASTLPGWIDRDRDRAVVHAGMVAESARVAVDEARSLLTELRVGPDDARIEAWVVERVGVWSDHRSAPVRTQLSPVPALGPLVFQELRAAVDEALENVDRHAPHAAVRVGVCRDGGEVVVTVADDGPGFEPARREEAVRQDRFGLVGIQERLASVGGRGQVESVPGEGTTVRLAVPVPAAARAALAARDDDPPRLALRLS